MSVNINRDWSVGQSIERPTADQSYDRAGIRDTGINDVTRKRLCETTEPNTRSDVEHPDRTTDTNANFNDSLSSTVIRE